MKMNRYTLCMAAAALFAVLALTGCSLLKVAVATGDPLSKEEMNIRTMTMIGYIFSPGQKFLGFLRCDNRILLNLSAGSQIIQHGDANQLTVFIQFKAHSL